MILVPLTEVAPRVMNSRAFFLESARPVVTKMSTKLVPLATIGG